MVANQGRIRKYLVILLFLAIIIFPSIAMGATVSTGDSAYIGPAEIVDDDLYIFGDIVTISGTVLGDAVIFAREVVIDGAIKGSLLVFAETVKISGDVEGTIRGGANTIIYQGTAGRDLIVGANTISIAGPVSQDFFGAANNITISGLVGRNVKASANRLVIDAPVGGDINGYINELVVAPGAVIGGNITYTSENEALIDSQAVITGSLRRLDPPGDKVFTSPGRSTWSFIRPILSLLVLALVMVLLFPVFTAGTARTIREKPGISLGYGALLVFVVPAAALLLLITVIAIPVSLLSMLLYIVLISLTRVFAGYFLAQVALEKAGKNLHPVWTGLIGVFFLALLIKIPYIGWLIHLAAVLFAAGAVILYLTDKNNAKADQPQTLPLES